MKKNIHLLCILCLLLLNCSVVDELTRFDIDYEIEYTIPPVSIINIPISLNTPDIETENETTFENNNTNKNSIESIRLKSLTLNITDPETANFNFLKDIRIYIKTENVEEREIANLIDIENSNSRVLDLKILNKELEDYVKEDQFTLRVVAVADEKLSLEEFLKNKDYLKFSRIPIYTENDENITGYVFRQTVFEKLAEDQHKLKLKDIKRDIVIVPNSIVLYTLWEKLLEKKEHISLIVDEYGGLDGIVTMEDIIETLLGLEIIDEKDTITDMQKYARERWKERQTKYDLLNKLNKEDE